MSISTTLFPAIAERDSVHGRANSHGLYWRVMKFLVVGMLPVSIFLFVFSREILQLWLGGDFPATSNMVLKILAGAVFLQALGYVPLTTLQAIGRPDISARYYLAEIPLYFVLCFVLVPVYGIEGAAWAWFVRLVIITSGLMWSAKRELGQGQSTDAAGHVWRALILNVVLCAGVFGLEVAGLILPLTSVILVIIAIGYSAAVWALCLTDEDKKLVVKLAGRTGQG
jgi:O-antigen/teichoic acid export membrane protein